MSIQQKLEQIRNKPERIRLRYVWACTAFSMVFVLAIWALSFSSGAKTQKADTSLDISGSEIMGQFKNEAKSLTDTANKAKGVFEKAPSYPGTDAGNSLNSGAKVGENNLPGNSVMGSEEGFLDDARPKN